MDELDLWNRLTTSGIDNKEVFDDDNKFYEIILKVCGETKKKVEVSGNCIICSCFVSKKLEEKKIGFEWAIEEGEEGNHCFIVAKEDDNRAIIDISRPTTITTPIFVKSTTCFNKGTLQFVLDEGRIFQLENGELKKTYKLEIEKKSTLDILRNDLKILMGLKDLIDLMDKNKLQDLRKLGELINSKNLIVKDLDLSMDLDYLKKLIDSKDLEDIKKIERKKITFDLSEIKRDRSEDEDYYLKEIKEAIEKYGADFLKKKSNILNELEACLIQKKTQKEIYEIFNGISTISKNFFKMK